MGILKTLLSHSLLGQIMATEINTPLASQAKEQRFYLHGLQLPAIKAATLPTISVNSLHISPTFADQIQTRSYFAGLSLI